MADDAQILDLSAILKDTINHKVVPIIVVPGVMGTRLDMQGAAPNWDPDDPVGMGDWAFATDIERVQFLNPARTPSRLVSTFGKEAHAQVTANGSLIGLAAQENPHLDVEQFYVNRGWTAACWGFYGALLVQLETQLNVGRRRVEMPVYCVGYDWRETNLKSGARLVSEISRILGLHQLAQKVIVVTHSMGGLVTRAAMSVAGTQKMAGVVHCVIPADGAAVAYRRFQTGANRPFDVTPPGATFKEIIAQALLNRIMGAERVSYAAVQSVLDGPVQLLPSNAYNGLFLTLASGAGDNTTISDVYAVYAQNSPPGIVPNVGESATDLTWLAQDTVNLQARINGARALHAQIRGVFHPNTFILLGDGLRTDVEFDWNLGVTGVRGNTADLQLKTVQVARQGDPRTGDGTVPAISAQFPAVSAPLGRFSFPGVGHAECFQSTPFASQVEASVRTLYGMA